MNIGDIVQTKHYVKKLRITGITINIERKNGFVLPVAWVMWSNGEYSYVFENDVKILIKFEQSY